MAASGTFAAASEMFCSCIRHFMVPLEIPEALSENVMTASENITAASEFFITALETFMTVQEFFFTVD